MLCSDHAVMHVAPYESENFFSHFRSVSAVQLHIMSARAMKLAFLLLFPFLALGCDDDDAKVRTFLGNTTRVTCSAIGRLGRCVDNCGVLSNVCCKTCADACSAANTSYTLYCEILAISSNGGSQTGTVYYNDGCDSANLVRSLASPNGYTTLNRAYNITLLDVIAVHDACDAAIWNGQRVWLTQSNVPCCGKTPPTDKVIIPAGVGPTWVKAATLEGLDQGHYIAAQVARSVRLTWCSGCEIYQLIAPNGDVYTMQSMSRAVDLTLQPGDLPSLGKRLSLPSGWSFRVQTLASDLVHEARVASVLQDDLENSYTLMDSGASGGDGAASGGGLDPSQSNGAATPMVWILRPLLVAPLVAVWVFSSLSP